MSLWDAEPVPSRVIGLIHTALLLENESDGPIAREKLESWCAPRSLTGREDHRQFDEVLAECRHLNLLAEQESKGFFRVSSALRSAMTGSRRADWAHISTATRLADLVRGAVLDHLAGNPAPDPNFCRMLSWLLMQRGSEYPLSKDAAERLANRQDPERSVIGFNDVRFGSTRFWTVFLGFGWQQALESVSGAVEALQPDPTDAIARLIRREKPESDPSAESPLVPLNDFLRRVGEVYPWMEQGSVACAVREGLSEPPLYPEGQLSDTMSLALLRLERKGMVRLHRPSDAEVSLVRKLDWGGPRREASHVQIQGMK